MVKYKKLMQNEKGRMCKDKVVFIVVDVVVTHFRMFSHCSLS